MSPVSRDQKLNPGPAHYQTLPEGFFGSDGIKVRYLAINIIVFYRNKKPDKGW